MVLAISYPDKAQMETLGSKTKNAVVPRSEFKEKIQKERMTKKDYDVDESQDHFIPMKVLPIEYSRLREAVEPKQRVVCSNANTI